MRGSRRATSPQPLPLPNLCPLIILHLTFSGAPSRPSNHRYSTRWARALTRTTQTRACVHERRGRGGVRACVCVRVFGRGWDGGRAPRLCCDLRRLSPPFPSPARTLRAHSSRRATQGRRPFITEGPGGGGLPNQGGTVGWGVGRFAHSAPRPRGAAPQRKGALFFFLSPCPCATRPAFMLHTSRAHPHHRQCLFNQLTVRAPRRAATCQGEGEGRERKRPPSVRTTDRARQKREEKKTRAPEGLRALLHRVALVWPAHTPSV